MWKGRVGVERAEDGCRKGEDLCGKGGAKCQVVME